MAHTCSSTKIMAGVPTGISLAPSCSRILAMKPSSCDSHAMVACSQCMMCKRGTGKASMLLLYSTEQSTMLRVAQSAMKQPQQTWVGKHA